MTVDTMLGLKIRHGRLYIEPNLPSSLTGYKAKYHLDGEILNIEVSKKDGA